MFKSACDAAGISGLTFHDLRGTAVTMSAGAGRTVPEIAAITGQSIRSAEAIVAKYMARTRLQARSAMDRLEAWLQTSSANHLQTLTDVPVSVPGDGDVSA